MRAREIWLWLGGAWLTAGGVLTAAAVAYFTVDPHTSLGASPQMLAAYGAFGLAFLCFLAAVTGWRPWLRWLRFPNLVVRADGGGFSMATKEMPGGFPPEPVRLEIVKVHITNAEGDRKASIRAAYLVAKTKPESGWPCGIFTAPTWPITSLAGPPINPLQFPVNLEPQASAGGDLVFEMSGHQLTTLVEPLDARIEIHDAITGKIACFPASTISTFSRRNGLRPTTLAERFNGPKAAPPWHGLMGPPDPEAAQDGIRPQAAFNRHSGRSAGKLASMPPEPDRRWENIIGGLDDGHIRPMSFDILQGLASEWAGLLPDTVGADGPAALLRMARSLFAHSWFDYEFMVVACLTGLQAMEAAFRVLYPDAERKPFKALIRRARTEGLLPDHIADLAETGAELRNLFSHPATQAAFTVGMAAPMLENTHRMVALVMTAAASAPEPPTVPA